MKIIDTNKLNRFWKNGVKPIKDSVAKKFDTSKVINNLLTTKAGYALDARQGKVLQDQVSEINSNLSELNTGLESITNRCYVYVHTGVHNFVNGYAEATFDISNFSYFGAFVCGIATQLVFACSDISTDPSYRQCAIGIRCISDSNLNGACGVAVYLIVKRS